MIRSVPDAARRLAHAATSFIVGTLAALLLAGLTPADAVVVPSPAIATYAYDTPHHDQLKISATTEHGPPVAHAPRITYHAADRWSHGALVRPDTATPRLTATYDDRPLLGQVAGVTAMTREPEEQVNPEPSLLTVTGVAANGVAKGDHIVLGIADEGLEATAAKVGGRTLMSDPAWRQSLLKAIDDPSTQFTVSLDGFSGSTVNSQVMGAVTRAPRRQAS